VRQAVAEADLAALQEARTDALVQKGYAGQEELDRARRDTAVAQARRVAAESRAALVKTRFLPEDVALAEAKVAQAQAVVDEAEATLSYTTIAAPITGVIAQVATQEGETVSAGLNSPTFVTLIDLDRLEVAAYVDEVDVGRIAVGSPATFTVDAFPDVEFKGSVTAVYPRAVVQSNVVNYITTVRIENSEGRLKPDMTANVVIELAARANVVAVPDRALKREGGKTVVAVMGPQGRELRPVRVGLRGGGLTEIVSGLAEGERIVTAEVLQGESK
jgi:RND family efflux transporter MFP subunit